MNSKKANWAFLITMIGYVALSYGIVLFFPAASESLFWSNLLCEAVVFLPVMLFILTSREKPAEFLGFHKIKAGTAAMIVLFTALSMPLMSLLNLITQFWVENEVALMVDEMNVGEMPFGLMYLSIGIIAPVVEETVCRGAFYRSYRKSGSAFRAMILSAVIFAVIHMNFNQAAYAFAIGILAVLLVEATGSLWSSVLYHGLINGSQAFMMYFVLKADPGAYGEQEITKDFLILAVAAYLFLTAVTLPLAWAVLVWISGHEGRHGVLTDIWKKRKEKKDKMVTVPFVLALILCIGFMTGAFTLLVLKLLNTAGIVLS